MIEVNYGFVDSNNKLLQIATFIEGDIETIERVKKEYNAFEYYPLLEPKGPAVIDNSIWTGEYFTPGSPHVKWIWNTEQELWLPPFNSPDDGKSYGWSDEINNWIEVIPQD